MKEKNSDREDWTYFYIDRRGLAVKRDSRKIDRRDTPVYAPIKQVKYYRSSVQFADFLRRYPLALVVPVRWNTNFIHMHVHILVMSPFHLCRDPSPFLISFGRLVQSLTDRLMERYRLPWLHFSVDLCRQITPLDLEMGIREFLIYVSKRDWLPDPPIRILLPDRARLDTTRSAYPDGIPFDVATTGQKTKTQHIGNAAYWVSRRAITGKTAKKK